jgi:hypothetical protein
MSTNNLSKEAEIRLSEFFKTMIDPESMAKKMRQVNYVLSLGVMRECETLQSEITNLENSFYWINKLAEVLDPYLDVETK